MSMPAFYLEPRKWAATLELDGQEAAHAHVLRLKKGDKILLLDGIGKSAICGIAEAGRKIFKLELESEDFAPEPESRAIIALALSKAVRRGFFMEKASELGAAAIWLWGAERSQGKLSPDLAEACRGQLIAGMKQCHNPWLPQIRVLQGVESVAGQAAGANWRIMPYEEQGGLPMLAPGQLGRPGSTVYVIGPEGGYTPAEVQCLRENGFFAVSLGKRVLRCETAASLCLGLHWWASQLPAGEK